MTISFPLLITTLLDKQSSRSKEFFVRATTKVIDSRTIVGRKFRVWKRLKVGGRGKSVGEELSAREREP